MYGEGHLVAASRKCPIAAVGPGTHIALCHVLSARRVSAERSGAKRMNRMWTLLIAIRSSLWCVPMGMVRLGRAGGVLRSWLFLRVRIVLQ